MAFFLIAFLSQRKQVKKDFPYPNKNIFQVL